MKMFKNFPIIYKTARPAGRTEMRPYKRHIILSLNPTGRTEARPTFCCTGDSIMRAVKRTCDCLILTYANMRKYVFTVLVDVLKKAFEIGFTPHLGNHRYAVLFQTIIHGTIS